MIRICATAEVPEGGWLCVGDKTYMVCRIDGTFHAYRLRCPHAGASKCRHFSWERVGREGEATRLAFRCGLHGYRYDASSGIHVAHPSQPTTDPLSRVRLSVLDDAIWIED
jgi:nitrite reductase/ring-hydroxylating ferredoxin subunit